MQSHTPRRRRPGPSGRAWWLKQMHLWHWVSAAVCLVGMLGFSATGITLNHAASIGAQPQVQTREEVVPSELLRPAPVDSTTTPLPAPLRDWLDQSLDLRVGARAAEWSESEIYLSLPRPGGDAWLSIDRASGELVYEHTDRGWVSYFNDLHKGRNTGDAWSWFLDIFAVASILFTLTGLVLLWLHGRHRPSTWPLVAAGLLVPALLAWVFIH